MRKKIRLFLKIFFLIPLVLFLTSCKNEESRTKIEVQKPNQFGLSVANLIEVRDTIDADQTLSDILIPHGVTQQKINQIEKAARDIFPLRSFRADDELYIYAKWDSVETVKYFVYVEDPVDYVVFDISDSVNIYKKQKPVTIRVRTVSGVISNSLYQTLQEKKIEMQVAARLEDIYAWQIDFFRIQPTDSFKVIYEQILVDGESVDVGKIHAANFFSNNENHFAFYYDKEKGENYFDEKGNSLKRLFLKAPLKYSRISSRFSMKRYHPILNRSKAHLGTDYAAPTGTPIITVGNGVVIEASYTSGNGNYIKVKHNATYTTQYLHMSRFAKGIRRGVSVTQGHVIGYVGSTGLATGPHVCFRFWKNGRQVNPLREKYQSSGPVGKKYKQEFDLVKNDWMKRLISVENNFSDIATQSKTKS